MVLAIDRAPNEKISSADVNGIAAEVNRLAELREDLDQASSVSVLSVTSTGAVGDGTADDSAAIAEAILAAATLGARTVYFPPGEYRTSEWIDVRHSNLTLLFAPGATVKPLNGANVGGIRVNADAAFEVENVVIDSFHFDGNDLTMDPAVRQCHGVIVDYARNVTIRNCFITRTHPYRVHNTGGSGISVEDRARDVRILDNYCYDIGDRGIQSAADGAVIAGNVTRDGYDRGIALNLLGRDHTTVQLAKNTTVSGNVVTGNSEGSGIGVGPGTSPVAISGYTDNIVLIGNVTEGNAHRGVRINGMRAQDGSITVIGHTSRDDGLAGISIDNVVLGHDGDILIEGCHIVSPLTGPGIDIGTNAKGVSVLGNIVRGAGGGPGINIQSGTSQVVVSGNTIRGIVQRVGIISRSICTITDNLIVDCGARGIEHQAGLGLGTLIRGNRILTCGMDPGGRGNEGIHLSSPAHVVDNIVDGVAGQGIDVLATAPETTLEGNVVKNLPATMFPIIIYASDCRASGNRFTGNALQELRVAAGTQRCRIDHETALYGPVGDYGTFTIVNGYGTATTAPSSADWPAGVLIENTTTGAVFAKTRSGAIVTLTATA